MDWNVVVAIVGSVSAVVLPILGFLSWAIPYNRAWQLLQVSSQDAGFRIYDALQQGGIRCRYKADSSIILIAVHRADLDRAYEIINRLDEFLL